MGLSHKRTCIQYFFDQTPRLLFISLVVLCSYYSRAAFISLESPWTSTKSWIRYASETMTVARRCQYYAEPLTPAVSRGYDSYNTNSLSASVVTVVRNYSHTCACAAFTSRSYYSRAVFISFKSFRLCGYYSRVASIRTRVSLLSRRFMSPCHMTRRRAGVRARAHLCLTEGKPATKQK